MKPPRRIVDDLVAHWIADGTAGSRFEINDGPCREFAEDLVDMFGRHRPDLTVTVMDTGDLPLDEQTISNLFHVWVVCGDRAYDAEAPGGCAIKDLPFFRRTGCRDQIARAVAERATSHDAALTAGSSPTAG